jgi:VanZ family protein
MGTQPKSLSLKKIQNFIPAIIVATIIFAVSSIPGETVEAVGLGKESYHIKGHFFLYFVLYLALYKGTKNAWLSWILATLYAITDEYHQLFVPGRSWQMIDIIVDSLGAGFAAIILWRFSYLLPTNLKNWLEK